MAVLVNEDILGFQVSVNDVVLVQMLDRQDELLDIKAGVVLAQFPFLLHLCQ